MGTEVNRTPLISDSAIIRGDIATRLYLPKLVYEALNCAFAGNFISTVTYISADIGSIFIKNFINFIVNSSIDVEIRFLTKHMLAYAMCLVHHTYKTVISIYKFTSKGSSEFDMY